MVMVDGPQGFKSSVPAVVAATSPDLAIVRFHGRRTETWEAKGIQTVERFRYLYDREELESLGAAGPGGGRARRRTRTSCSTTATRTTARRTPSSSRSSSSTSRRPTRNRPSNHAAQIPRYPSGMSAAPPIKVVVVGAGHVGATFAYALLLSGLAAEIVLVDAAADRAEGEAMDISHAVPLSRPTRVRSGTYEDCAGASIVVIAAGSGQRPGESRLDLAGRNASVIGAIVPRLAEVVPEAVLVVATNPVDVLTAHALGLGRFPLSRIMGSGTILDTARFRALLSEHFRVDARSVHAFVIGEHGDSEVPVWSLANIAGVRLDEFASAHGDRAGPRRTGPGSAMRRGPPPPRSSRARARRTTRSRPGSCASSRRSCATSGPCSRSRPGSTARTGSRAWR